MKNHRGRRSITPANPAKFTGPQKTNRESKLVRSPERRLKFFNEDTNNENETITFLSELMASVMFEGGNRDA